MIDSLKEGEVESIYRLARNRCVALGVLEPCTGPSAAPWGLMVTL